MSWWGKLAGGAFGFLLGGPLGAVLGIALGHQVDRGYRSLLEEPLLPHGDQQRVQMTFFTATFSVMGHIAKADGRVSEREIEAAKGIMAHMQLSAEQRAAAIGLFQQGKQPDFPLDDALAQLKQECRRRLNLIQMFLEIQILTALADGDLHAAERDVLLHICERLDYPRARFDQLVAMLMAQQRFHGGGQAARAGGSDLRAAYGVLGIDSDADDNTVKKAYRRLISQHHPDKLVAKGLPEEMMQLAKEKTQEIRAAYETIQRSRRQG